MSDIQNRIDALYSEINYLKDKQRQELFNNTNYVGKYLYHEMYGYMYVTMQSIQCDDDEVIPQLTGVAFSGYTGGRYDLDVYIDGNRTWNIKFFPEFRNEVTEISERKFIEAYKDLEIRYKQSGGLLEALKQAKKE